MPNSNNNGGLSLEALLAAARNAQEEAAETHEPEVAPSTAPAPATPAPATQAAPAQPASAAASNGQSKGASAAAGAVAAGTSAARAHGASAVGATAATASAEPVVEPSAAVQEQALEKAEEKEEAAPAFDLAAALGYGLRDEEPIATAKEPEEKFDLAAALGYKSQEVREREAAEAAAAEAEAQAQALQERAYREAEREVRHERGSHDTQPAQPQRVEQPEPSARAEQAERVERVEPVQQPAQQVERLDAARQPVPREPQTNGAVRTERIERSERVERIEQSVPQVERTEQMQRAEEPKQAASAEPMAAREPQSEPSVKREEQPESHRSEPKTVASVRDADRPQVRSRTFEATKTVSPEERYAAQKAAVQSATGADGSTIESYQPTKRDRSAQARAARPLKQTEVSEVAQAIAAEAARTEYVQPVVEVKEEVVSAETVVERPKEPEVPAEPKPAAQVEPVAQEPPAPTGEPVAVPSKDVAPLKEAPAPVGEPVKDIPAVKPAAAAEEKDSPQTEMDVRADGQTKPVDFMSPTFASSIVEGAPATGKASTPATKSVTMPHKVPVRTTEEIIKPAQAPIKLGVISPEAARQETAAKKKVQSAERKIVKKVRRFRTLGMFLIVLALAALAGAVFLFVAGNAQASESIESMATEICEQAGRTITYRYKAADSNGTLCPTTEVATFSSGDVLEQSVITMNTPDFETAGHTLANFKKQFQDSSYVDGRVDGSTVIFTLHMSNERIMKVTYTALLMKNTTGCEVIL